jgi:signal transduction histidine kinase
LRNHSGKLIGVVEDFKDITDRKKSEEKMQKLTYDLRVRVKELNCLYSLSKLVEKPGITLIEVLQGTVNLIPSAWQYSEITCACIIYVGHVYKTYNYKETIWKQACDIIAQKNQVGTVEVFYLEEKPERDEGPFLKEERDLIEIITGRLGRIVERIRAEEALKVAHDELERRVEERTIKLNQANVLLCQEIEDRKRTEEELKKSKMQLEFLSSQLINLQENERKQIAQELHDSVGQTLVSLKYRVEAVLKQMDKETGSSYTIPLKNLIPRVQDAINEVGRISKGLRPPMLDELGIIATFSWLCREFETIHTDIQIEQEIELQEDDVPETLKVVIYRILQEGLSNIVKHSGANLVHISFKKTDRTIELAIKDNGRGFNLKRALSLDNFNGGLGLINMRRRTENSGGSFEINSDKETGTCIRALWQCYG